MAIFNVDRGTIFKHQFSQEGYLNCYLTVARVGELKYYNNDGSEQIQVVEPEVLFDKDSIGSLKMKAVTSEHPDVVLDSSNTKQYLKGMTSPYVVIDGDFLGVIATVTDKELIDEIISGERQECSCGYYTDLEELPDGRFKQKNRKYNHLSIVKKGRAGEKARVQLDSESWQSEKIEVPFNIQFDTFLTKEKVKKSLMKFSLNGLTFDTDDQSLVAAAEVVTKKIEDLSGKSDSLKLNNDSLEATKSELITQVSALKSENETLTAKLQEAESKLINLDSQSSNTTAETIKFWVDVLPKLKEFNTDFEPDYAMPKVEVKRLLLKKMYPQMNFDGKSEDYLQGFYENASVNTVKPVEKTVEEEVKEEGEELNTDSQSPLTDALTNLYKGRQMEASGINESINGYVKNLESAWRTNASN